MNEPLLEGDRSQNDIPTQAIVEAPENLPEGHSFLAEYEGQNIFVIVPEGGVSKGQEMLIEFQSISSEDNSKNKDGERDSPKITERIKRYCTLFCPCFNRQRQQVVPGEHVIHI